MFSNEQTWPLQQKDAPNGAGRIFVIEHSTPTLQHSADGCIRSPAVNSERQDYTGIA